MSHLNLLTHTVGAYTFLDEAIKPEMIAETKYQYATALMNIKTYQENCNRIFCNPQLYQSEKRAKIVMRLYNSMIKNKIFRFFRYEMRFRSIVWNKLLEIELISRVNPCYPMSWIKETKEKLKFLSCIDPMTGKTIPIVL